MEPAIVLSISIGVFVLAVTVFSIYTAFGPPSAQLNDPFEDHED
ncbi:photosystem II reaction center protein PsbN [Microcoleus sp. FACHB-53]|jgi:PsbN protein|uniref:Protein PsbN n=1 Tax=Allocoleopsis franciscana PCC 7113 TaxID=1173027 RepID=K9WIC7_9CYAN|nr:photosystem II reaction center protein PsbN [Allocoleopsis franciscana]AFZ19953.1 Photosystem II reaction centre N protein (psbN) [Allocoleopsis franciscana PCC 7113]MBD2017480.1 photosystem II reaction center protein PsbN [Microcoleus sp. FACHB-53]MBD2129062.1 photosystem II reaction center protein PsbN [Microcoleus sp. FACHB-1]